MRILHIVTAFPRGPNDAIVPWLVELLKRLREDGEEVEVLTSAYRGGGNASFEGIPVHRFRYFPARWERLTHEENAADRMKRSPLFKVMPAFYVLCGMAAAWRLARRRRYDVIHVHWPVPHALLGWAARRASGAPIVTTFYGAEIRLATSGGRLLERFLAWSAHTSARVVAISRHTADDLRRIADVPVSVIPYSIGLAGAVGGAREPAHPFTVLFVGRLVERKGVHVLVRAMERLRGLDVRLVVIGAGPEREALERQATEAGLGDRVAFRGKVSDEELTAAYRSAGTLALPAVLDQRGDTEGLGVVLLEAMSYRVPVVASGVGGITDVVVDGESGLLVPPEDAAALAAAIRALATDADRARRIGEAGYERLQREFSWESITRRWIETYRSAVETGGAKR